jgi:hypothetical protein
VTDLLVVGICVAVAGAAYLGLLIAWSRIALREARAENQELNDRVGRLTQEIRGVNDKVEQEADARRGAEEEIQALRYQLRQRDYQLQSQAEQHQEELDRMAAEQRRLHAALQAAAQRGRIHRRSPTQEQGKDTTDTDSGVTPPDGVAGKSAGASDVLAANVSIEVSVIRPNARLEPRMEGERVFFDRYPPPANTVVVYGIVRHPALGSDPHLGVIAQKGRWRELIKEQSTDAVASTIADRILQPWVDGMDATWSAPYDPLHTAAAGRALDRLLLTEHRYLLEVPAEQLWHFTARGPKAVGDLAVEIASNLPLPGDEFISGIETFLEVAGAALALATGHAVAAAALKDFAEDLMRDAVTTVVRQGIRDFIAPMQGPERGQRPRGDGPVGPTIRGR